MWCFGDSLSKIIFTLHFFVFARDCSKKDNAQVSKVQINKCSNKCNHDVKQTCIQIHWGGWIKENLTNNRKISMSLWKYLPFRDFYLAFWRVLVEGWSKHTLWKKKRLLLCKRQVGRCRLLQMIYPGNLLPSATAESDRLA